MLDINFHITFKSKKRTADVSFKKKIETNAITALYGPSGIGKTTIFNIISGLVKPDAGSIQFDGDLWFENEQKINLKPSERNIAYLFQEYDLFPNMRIQDNLKFANSEGIIPEAVNNFLNNLDLNSYLTAYPTELSGGQKQRFALLRSLCQEPQLLILDEPFSASDDATVQIIISELQLLQKNQNLTILIATHRKDLAEQFADHVVEL